MSSNTSDRDEAVSEESKKFEPDVNEKLAGSQWIHIMLAVVAALPIVVRIAMLFMGWTPMVNQSHAMCIISTYTVCIGWPVIVIIFADAKQSKITVFKNALYKGIIINSLIITTVRLYLSDASQKNIFCNDLFEHHQLPRWVYAICIMSITFSTWFKFKPALWLNAAQIVPVAYGCARAAPQKPQDLGRMFVETMALVIVSLVLLYNSWRGHNAITGAAMNSRMLQLEKEKSRRLSAQRRGDRLMNHHVKNVMAEVYASLTLYTSNHGVTVADLRDAAANLKRAIVFLQKSLTIASIFDRTIKKNKTHDVTIPQQVMLLQDWLKQFAPKNTLIKGCESKCFLFKDSIVADIFADLSFGNCVKHGAGDVFVECTYDPKPPNESTSLDPEDPPKDKYSGLLRMDISNLMKDANAPPPGPGDILSLHQQLGNFSNGLGLEDMKDVCVRRNVPYRTYKADNRWHSVIELRASVAVATPTQETSSPPLPANLRVVIVDDQKMILRMAATILRRNFAGIKVSTFRLDTLDSYNAFCSSAKHACTTWNLFIVDQHFDYMHEKGVVRHGTDLLKLLLDSGFEGCLVMHSGNTTGSDIATYSACGAHGTVGKGAPNFANELARIYDTYLFHKRNNTNEKSAIRKRSLSLDEAMGTGGDDTLVKRRRRPK